MGMRGYVGVIHKADDSDFGLSFPDFPGVVTAGRTIAEVRQLAEQALAFHVEVSSRMANPFRSRLHQTT